MRESTSQPHLTDLSVSLSTENLMSSTLLFKPVPTGPAWLAWLEHCLVPAKL